MDLLLLALGIYIGLLAGFAALWLVVGAYYRRAWRRNNLELSPEFRAAMQRALRARGAARRGGET